MLLTAAALTVYHFDPAASSVYPPCFFRWMTGWHCPGCGMARALHAAARGDLRAAASLNPLGIVLAPIAAGALLISMLARGTRLSNRLDEFSRGLPAKAIWFIAALIAGFGVLRNLPYYPFTLLAPG